MQSATELQSEKTISSLIQLLRRKLNTEFVDGMYPMTETDPNVDLVLFYNLLAVHDVESQVYELVRENQVYLHPELSSVYKEKVDFKRRNNLILLPEMIRVTCILDASGIPYIISKGVILGWQLYGNFTSRTSADIDILINAKDFQRIRRLLMDDGYEELYPYTERFPDFYLRQNREANFRKHVSGNLFIYLEVQWAPLTINFQLPFNNEYFMQHRRLVKIPGGEVYILEPTQQLIMILVHHGFTDLWRSFHHVSDLAAFLKRHGHQVDWGEIQRIASDWKLRKSFAVGLYLANHLFGYGPGKLPEGPDVGELKNVALEGLLSYPLLPKKKKTVDNIRRQLAYCDTILGKLSLLKGYAWLTLRPGLEDVHRVKLPRSLFPLYYLVKRFRFLGI